MKYSSVGEKLSVSWEGEGAPGLRAQGGSPGGSALDPALPGEADLPLLFPPGPSLRYKAHTVPAEFLVGSAEQELQACCTGMLWLRWSLRGEGCDRTGPRMLVKAADWLLFLPALHGTALGGLAGPCAHSTAQPCVCAIASQGCFSSSLSPEPQKFYKVQQTGIQITATLPLMRRVVWSGWPALSKCFTMPQAPLGSK